MLARSALAAVSLVLAFLGGWLLHPPGQQQQPAGFLRTPTGVPDLNGIWQAMSSAHFDLEPHPARAALAFRPGPVVPVPAREVLKLGAVGAVPAGIGVVEGGLIPYKPEALARKKENQARWLERDPEISCFLPGVPRANYMPYPFQIVQSESAMLFAYEYAGATRNIHFQDPGPPIAESWMGQSVARWENDSLVITVTGQNAQTWLDRSGNHHSAALKVVERFTPAGAGILHYEATLEDPETYTRPWKLSLNLYRREGKEARLLQFKCVEFVEELLYGKLRKKPLL